MAQTYETIDAADVSPVPAIGVQQSAPKGGKGKKNNQAKVAVTNTQQGQEEESISKEEGVAASSQEKALLGTDNLGNDCTNIVSVSSSPVKPSGASAPGGEGESKKRQSKRKR